METGGLWMLAAAGVLMLATGLPAWVAVYESSMQASAGSKDSSEVEEHA